MMQIGIGALQTGKAKARKPNAAVGKRSIMEIGKVPSRKLESPEAQKVLSTIRTAHLHRKSLPAVTTGQRMCSV